MNLTTSLSDFFALGSLAQLDVGADFALGKPDFWALGPVIALACGALLVLLLDLALPRNRQSRQIVQTLGYVTLFVGFALSLSQWGGSWHEDPGLASKLSGSLAPIWNVTNFSVMSALIAQGITILCLCFTSAWMRERDHAHFGEYHFLLLLFPLGIIVMTTAKHLLLAFLGLEIFSISLYILVGVRRGDRRSIESALKYFLLGAFAAAIFLYGMALIYAGSGSGLLLQPNELAKSVTIQGPTGLAALGGGLLFAALFFKASIVPFQMWTPDVYEGAPTPITALMSTGTKAGAFLLMLSTLHLFPKEALPVFGILTLATIVVGNAGAIVQTNLKRLLAYSGIAHAGYLLLAITACATAEAKGMTDIGIKSVMFYLVVYAVTNLAAFGALAYLERQEEGVLTLDGIKGLARRNPYCSAAIALAMFSLAGIPPTAGFWAKYQIFHSAIYAGQNVLAVVAILASVIGLYYYLRIVVNMYFVDPENEKAVPARGISAPIGIAFSSAVILILGLAPGLLIDWLAHRA